MDRTRAAVSPPQLREHLKLAALITATVITAYLCYKILLPFLPALVWAVALTVVVRPLHRRLDRRLKRRNLSSAIVVVITTLALVIPVVLITQEIVDQAVQAIQTVRSPQFINKVKALVASHPRWEDAFSMLQQRVNLQQQAQALAGNAGSAVPAAFMGSLGGLTQLLIALFTTFFFLRDFEHFAGVLRSLVPLSERDTSEVLKRINDTIDASIRGRVLVAAIQGALGGLMFWFLGIPGALLWGTVMGVVSLVPMLGSFVVWGPAALYLAATGSLVKAAILVGWGALVVGTVDNLLYPILVGKDIRLHTLTIFFAVLGGIAVFGASGLVIGPVVFALADALVDIWNRRVARGRGAADRDLVA